MSRPDAERALSIYKEFGRQTEEVVQYLSLARQYETSTRLEVPKLKHAPTTLTSSLEEYLNDPDFEINRRQYMVQQDAKRTGKPVPVSKPVDRPAAKVDNTFLAPSTRAPQRTSKGPSPDLIDFFESIEQNQQPMGQQSNLAQQPYGPGFAAPTQPYQQVQPQQTGYNPFLQQQALPQDPQQPQQAQPLQPDFTGAGFGGYTAQPQNSQSYSFTTPLTSIPQNGVAEFQSQTQPQVQTQPQQLQPQATSTNPFRQSTMPTSAAQAMNAAPTRQSTNPFAKHNTGVPATAEHNAIVGFDQGNPSSFGLNQSHSPQQEPQSNASFFSASPTEATQPTAFSPVAALQPQRTGTNPFAKNRPPPASAAPLSATATGSTNPFRQSAFVNQQTGQGWQHSNQGTYSGFDVNNVDTVAVFPRPGAS